MQDRNSSGLLRPALLRPGDVVRWDIVAEDVFGQTSTVGGSDLGVEQRPRGVLVDVPNEAAHHAVTVLEVPPLHSFLKFFSTYALLPQQPAVRR